MHSLKMLSTSDRHLNTIPKCLYIHLIHNEKHDAIRFNSSEIGHRDPDTIEKFGRISPTKKNRTLHKLNDNHCAGHFHFLSQSVRTFRVIRGRAGFESPKGPFRKGKISRSVYNSQVFQCHDPLFSSGHNRYPEQET